MKLRLGCWQVMLLIVGSFVAAAAIGQPLRPDPLLSVDQNRRVAVERIVGQWGDALERSDAGITSTQLRDMLEGLRADHLFAASLAGSLSGLRDVLATALTSTAPVKGAVVAAKTLGDTSRDLVYTPVSPCRLFDTRPSQGGSGVMAPSVRRTYGATAPVASQGGPGGCVAGAGAAVALIQIGTVSPAGSGVLQGGPQGVASFPNALVLYQAGDQYGTAVAMPLNIANGQFDVQVLFAATDLYADLLGYFKPPAGGFVTSVGTGTGLTGGPVTSAGTIGVAAGGIGTTELAATSVTTAKLADANVTSAKLADTSVTTAKLVDTSVTTVKLADASVTLPKLSSMSCTSGQILKYNGASWACAADDNAGGTLTSITAGTGLSGGTITGSGTIAIATGGVGNAQLANASVDVSKLDTTSTDARYFRQGGNAFGSTARLGSSDNTAVEVYANAQRAMRYEANDSSPNLIGGFVSNTATSGTFGATIAGGGMTGTIAAILGQLYPCGTSCTNRVTDIYGTVGGGIANQAGDGAGSVDDHVFATVGGGYFNIASGQESTIAGGGGNIASAVDATVGGGSSNSATNAYATIAGGASNTASGLYGAVGGGQSNVASVSYATIGGGLQNSVNGGLNGTIGGGYQNIVNQIQATIGGGAQNTASHLYATVAGGLSNTASGQAAAIPGGASNTASGDYSFAAGRRAKAANTGAVAFADSNNFDFVTNASDEFAVRATGGVRFVVGIDANGAPNATCSLPVGGVGGWSCPSDRNLKQNLRQLDARAVLDKLVLLPIYEWNPKGANAHILHFGPVAQDFHAAFGLGDSDIRIGQQDADGVALAAIQGLNAKVEERTAALQRLVQEKDAKIDALVAELADLRRAVEVLLARISPEGKLASMR